MLARNLPLGSRVASVLDDRASWTNTDYLLASIYDAVRDTAWVTAQVQNPKHIPHPKPLPRPGGATRELAPVTSGSDLARFLGR